MPASTIWWCNFRWMEQMNLPDPLAKQKHMPRGMQTNARA